MHVDRLRLRVSLLLLAASLVGCDHGSKRVSKKALEGQAPRTLIAGALDLDYAV
jgi:hypothetical protein